MDDEKYEILPGDLAKEFGCSITSLRNWERDGKIPPSKRTPGGRKGGHRRYCQAHRDALRRMLGGQNTH